MDKIETQYRNSEAKFASPESNEGIGYYVEGEEVTPEEFSKRVSADADRIKSEREAETS